MNDIVLNTVHTKFGIIFVETLAYKREEDDRVKIYDSDGKYLDYFTIEELEHSAKEMETTIEEEYAARILAFRDEDDFGTLVTLIGQWEIEDWSDNPFDYAKPLGINLEDEKRLLHEIVSNDYVCRIGKYYLLIAE